MSVTAESAPPQAHYARMIHSALTIMVRRAGGSVTLTRSEFDDVSKLVTVFDATEDVVTFEVRVPGT